MEFIGALIAYAAITFIATKVAESFGYKVTIEKVIEPERSGEAAPGAGFDEERKERY